MNSLLPILPKFCQRWLIGLLILALNQGLTGCATSVADQCKKLMLITQKTSEQSQKYRQTTDSEEVLKVSDAFEEAAERLEKLNLQDPTLAQHQNTLATVYRGNAESSRTMLQALASKDILTAQLAQNQVQTLGQQERQAITDINVHCQNPE